MASPSSAEPQKKDAQPMSRTKCTFSGPVCVTPGMTGYQLSGEHSIQTPLATRPSPSTTVSTMRMSLSHFCHDRRQAYRSEEHTSELQSLMRISYAVFCLKKQKQTNIHSYTRKD